MHNHKFVEEYKDLVGFGLDRETNEATLIVYLQKFSDDNHMDVLRKRMSDEEIEELFMFLSGLLRKHLSEEEYHQLFLKELSG